MAIFKIRTTRFLEYMGYVRGADNARAVVEVINAVLEEGYCECFEISTELLRGDPEVSPKYYDLNLDYYSDDDTTTMDKALSECVHSDRRVSVVAWCEGVEWERPYSSINLVTTHRRRSHPNGTTYCLECEKVIKAAFEYKAINTMINKLYNISRNPYHV